jgi:hypothetical protein
MATKDMDTPAPQFKQTWSIERTARHAIYEAWRTNAPVSFMYRGTIIEVTQNILIAQVIADCRTAKSANI